MLVALAGLILGVVSQSKKKAITFTNVLETPNKASTTMRPTATPVAADVFLVVNWQAASGELQVGKLGGNKIVKITVEVPKTRVLIPVTKQGVTYDEVVMQKEHNEWYRLAFCGGDQIEIAGLGKDWEGFANNQVIWIKSSIRNLGPRKCVN